MNDMNYRGNTTHMERDKIYLSERREKLDKTRWNLVDQGGDPREIEKLNGKIAEIDADLKIVNEQRLAGLEKGVVNATAARAAASFANGPARGQFFADFGEQLQAIAKAGSPGGRADDRLFQVFTAAGGNESVSSEGGFLVEPVFASELIRQTYDSGVVAKLCRNWPVGQNSNGVKLPAVDETSRANGSRWGGIQAYGGRGGHSHGDEARIPADRVGALEADGDQLRHERTASRQPASWAVPSGRAFR